MFGNNNPFGQQQQQPTSGAFGSPSVFGQPASNPFAPKPFGSPSPFGSPAGNSIFGGTSTGVFGQASSPAFGASSASPFGSGSSAPAFGASPTPAFGGGSGGFGASSSGFGGKSAFGGFGSTTNQASPFGASSQPTFGNSLFGSTSQPAFGAATSSAFGATSTPAFGSTSTPAFGSTSTPAFGSTTPAFGSTTTPLFGNTGSGFGSSVTPAFGAQSSSLFGSSSTPAFGAPSTPAFGSTSTPAFGSSSTPAFGFGSTTTPSFGQQSASAFGSTPFGTTPSPFNAQSSPFGAQTASPFGQAFGAQPGGTRVTPFTPTPEADTGTATQPAGKLESISAMPAYKDKSHEELRWEDYQRNDKGGPNPSGQPASGLTFPATSQASPFGSPSPFGQPQANTSPFGQPQANTSPFGQAQANPSPFGQPQANTSPFGQPQANTSPFGQPQANTSPFGQTQSNPSPFGQPQANPSPFGQSQSNPFSTTSSLFPPKTSAFNSGFGSTSTTFNSPFSSSPSPFGQSTTNSGFGSTPSIFSGTAAPTSSPFGSNNFGNTQSSGLFQSSPSMGQTTSPFGQPATGFQQNSLGFNSNLFSTPSTGFGGGGNMFSNTASSLINTNNPGGFGVNNSSFQAAPTLQTQPSFSFNNFAQSQPASTGSYGNMFNTGMPGQSMTSTLPNMVVQPTPVANPFGTLPPLPRLSFGGRTRSGPSIQYGISSMPVADEPAPVRLSSLLVPRHYSQRRIRLPARNYHPKPEGQRVPFFADEVPAPTTPKADALFFPRENPRKLFVRPIEEWPSNTKKQPIKAHPVNGNGNVLREPTKPSAPVVESSFEGDHNDSPDENGRGENGHNWENNNAPSSSEPSQKPNGVHSDHPQKGGDPQSSTLSGHRAGEAAIAYEHGADIEALMPKLRSTDYYTVPRIQELAAKERANPGFCRHVKDFVIGRHGFGSIRFLEEVDVRGLDLESIVRFNNREVTVYMKASKKPPVGQGLNKPAEVTLLNMKSFKKTGEHVVEGPRVERFKEGIVKKTAQQGAEFVSYSPVTGEWKFRVKHFSKYGISHLEELEVEFSL